MNWVYILELCMVARMTFVTFFLAYKIGYSNGHFKGYVDALDDVEKEIMIANQKETKED